jgi:actin-related protein
MSSPVLSTVAAGLRSALVVDIGWHETTISGVFELRELLHYRTDRAGKMLSREMGKLLARESTKSQEWHEPKDTIADGDESLSDEVSFEETQEVLARVAWCRNYNEASCFRSTSQQESPEETFADAPEQLESLSITERDSEGASPASNTNDPTIIVPLQSTAPPTTVRLPMSRFAEPCETTLFATSTAVDEDWDDNEVPIHHLAYSALLSLPMDARSICMSRIIVTGGVSSIPGVKNRVVDEVAALYAERGWEKVRGKAAERRRKRLEEINHNLQSSPRPVETQKTSGYPHDDISVPLHTSSPALEDPKPDPIDEKLHRENSQTAKPSVQGIVRGVETLGAWAGGALIGNLKVKGIAQIEQDKFLQHGLAGASKEGDISVTTQRFSIGPSGTRGTSAGERSSWTLGVFG